MGVFDRLDYLPKMTELTNGMGRFWAHSFVKGVSEIWVPHPEWPSSPLCAFFIFLCLLLPQKAEANWSQDLFKSTKDFRRTLRRRKREGGRESKKTRRKGLPRLKQTGDMVGPKDVHSGRDRLFCASAPGRQDSERVAGCLSGSRISVISLPNLGKDFHSSLNDDSRGAAADMTAWGQNSLER